MHDPREPHLAALKRILRYVQGTLDLGLHLYASSTTFLVGYTDSDWAGYPSTLMSTSGYDVFLGDNLLSWSAKRHHTLSRSSAEDEYRGNKMGDADINTLTMEQYCLPSNTTKQLEEIHNFKQEGDETLYQAWKRYNDLLYKCLTHDLKSHQKVNIFYKGLDTMTRQLLDSQGLIPNKIPAQALAAIQPMAEHLQK
ncbi:ribonuclease H-like domain-containing protein [Tanacetum coccineum]